VKHAAGIATAGLAIAVLGASAWGSRSLAVIPGWLTTTGVPLLATGAVLAGLAAIGGRLRDALAPHVAADDGPSRWLLALGLGVAVAEIAMLLLGLGGLATAPVRLGLAAALALAGLAHLGLRPPRLTAPDAAVAAAWAVAAALVAPSLLSLGAPPLGPDEAQYHRRFIEALARTGRFAGDPLDPTSGLVQGLHGVASLPVALVGTAAMRPFGWLLGLAGVLAGERVLRRTVGAGAAAYPLVVLGAASLLAALPTFGTDAPLALFVGLGALAALDAAAAPTDPDGRYGVLGLLGAGGLLAKFTAPVFLAPFWLLLGWRLLATAPSPARARAWARLLGSALLPLLAVSPWLVRNHGLFGHPLFPLMGLHPPADLVGAFPFNFSDHYGGGDGLQALLRAPWELFAWGQEFDRRLFLGRLNPWPLVGAVGGIVLLARPAGRRLLVPVAAGFVLWALALRRVAYLLPLWPLIAAATAASLGTVVRDRRAGAAGLLVMASVAAVEAAPALHRQIDDAEVATGTVAPDVYAQARTVEALPLSWLRARVEGDDAVAFLFAWSAWELPNRSLYLGAEECTPLRLALLEAGTADAFADHLRAEGVRWIVQRELPFFRDGFPGLTDEQFEQAFARPLAIADEAVERHGTLRFEHGPIRVFELAAEKP
jgi:hypothetical protein